MTMAGEATGQASENIGHSSRIAGISPTRQECEKPRNVGDQHLEQLVTVPSRKTLQQFLSEFGFFAR
jgi:hypothetical protein